jgi:hypothetical protein
MILLRTGLRQYFGQFAKQHNHHDSGSRCWDYYTLVKEEQRLSQSLAKRPRSTPNTGQIMDTLHIFPFFPKYNKIPKPYSLGIILLAGETGFEPATSGFGEDKNELHQCR